MNQGDVYLVNLDPAVQTEAGKKRPGLIISINAMNHNSPRLIIAPITSSVGKIYPFEVFVPAGGGGLEKDSKGQLLANFRYCPPYPGSHSCGHCASFA